jgi:2-oxo-4-hydroxy-4-carboxy-5-ureidoimidazoline decarboxylase
MDASSSLDRVSWLNALPAAEARAELLRCCGSSRWADAMLARRPFADAEALQAEGEAAWNGLLPADWLEAFRHHPRIGDKEALRARFAATRAWAEGEQSGALGASEDVLEALAEGNRAYEERFGYIFTVCATGKSADEMLAALRQRLGHEPEAEIRVAASEQAKITRIRLEKLLASE